MQCIEPSKEISWSKFVVGVMASCCKDTFVGWPLPTLTFKATANSDAALKSYAAKIINASELPTLSWLSWPLVAYY